MQRMWDAAQGILDKGETLQMGEVKKEVFFEITAALEDMDDGQAVGEVGVAMVDKVVDVLQEEGMLDDALDAESIEVLKMRRMARKVQAIISGEGSKK